MCHEQGTFTVFCSLTITEGHDYINVKSFSFSVICVHITDWVIQPISIANKSNLKIKLPSAISQGRFRLHESGLRMFSKEDLKRLTGIGRSGTSTYRYSQNWWWEKYIWNLFILEMKLEGCSTEFSRATIPFIVLTISIIYKKWRCVLSVST